MGTVTFSVGGIEEANRRALAAFRGEPQGSWITFQSAEHLFETMTTNRWHIVRALVGAGPKGIRETARLVGRDVKGVHTDLHALLGAGVLERDEEGRFVFPYDAIHIDVVVKAA